ncbi:MAG: hypothetical protein IKM32_05590 [Clostridia bacterium]|nr:hypothetical protein [Clostridia bacterium]
MRALKAILIILTLCTLFSACGKQHSGLHEESAEETSINEQLLKDGYVMNKTVNENGYTLDLEFEKRGYNANNQPFENSFYYGKKRIEITNAASKRANIEYKKREGGTYIYSNNPEMLAPEDIGQAILRTNELEGDIIFTYEHSNHTGVPVYFGYQILNDGDSEITVTVSNLGFQPDGEWLGQRSWSDYFNYKFELPEDYFLANGAVNPIYVGCDYIDYTPTVREPVSYKVPAGEYIYVLGGTSADAYGNANVFGSADTPILPGKCSNAVVKFNISGGKAIGTFYVYTNAAQVQANPKEQGFITERFNSKTQKLTDYSKQYKGVDYTAGLIESNITFVVDDETKAGKLPVSYTKYHDPNYASKNTPYAKYDLQPKEIKATEWVTALNPNGVPMAIGTDMMIFNCIDTEGNEIVIDTERADSSGEPANIGNWMVQYTDNFTLVNAGSEEKTFSFFKRGNSGVLFVMTRDECGNIINAKALTGPYNFASLDDCFAGVNKSLLVQKNGRWWFKIADGRPFCDVIDERSEVIKITVEPNSVKRISIDYVILGNSCGGTTHWVVLD